MELRRRTLVSLLIIVLVISTSAVLTYAKKKHDKAAAGSELDEQKRALHALNRLTFGPRPGDVERVAAMGVDKWIEQQLHPDSINDSALEARLAGFRTLKMDARALVQNFPPPQVAKAVANGRLALPNDPAKRAIVEAQMQR